MVKDLNEIMKIIDYLSAMHQLKNPISIAHTFSISQYVKDFHTNLFFLKNHHVSSCVSNKTGNYKKQEDKTRKTYTC